MSVEIVEVNSSKKLDQFIQFPNQLYKGNPYYVPSIHLAMEWMLTKKNPFLKHSQIALFLAFEDSKVAGRIAAILNTTHLEKYNDDTGFFGFFDSVNNPEIARSLFNTASDWLRSKGLKKMMGPTNLTTNDSCGVLVEGFDLPPMVLMPYNFEYYNDLYMQSDLQRETDLYSYQIDGSSVIERYDNVIARTSRNLENSGVAIRPLSKKHFFEDINNLRLVYNQCNENNWGFIPLNDEEFREMARDLIRITTHDLSLVVEKGGSMIGFIIAIPNINQSLKYLKNGKLFPFGLIRLLWFKRKIDSARILILGLLKEHSGHGIDLVLYKRIKEALNKRGIFSSEACYVFETNHQMNSILKKIDGKCIKKFRMYQAEIK
jgi:hypothetical protein